MIRRFLLLVFVSFQVLYAEAGIRDFTKKVLDENQDFFGTFIYNVVQDQDGFLWIGSDDGLYRYDGRKMINLNERDSTVGDLVTAMQISTDGHLYLGYYHGGISIVEHSQYRKVISKDDLPYKVIDIINLPGENNLLALTSNGIFVNFRNGKQVQTPIGELSGLIIHDLVHIDNELLVATSDGVFVYNIDATSKITSNRMIEDLEYVNCKSIFLDEYTDRIWVGTDEGLYYTSRSELNFKSFAEFDRLVINTITTDQRGNLWLGSANNGLFEVIFNNDTYKVTHFSESNGLESNEINYLYSDREDEVWVGTFGKGLIQLNRADFHHYSFRDYFDIDRTRALVMHNDMRYIATNLGLIRGYNKPYRDSLNFEMVDEFAGKNVSALLSYEHTLLVGVEGEGLYSFDEKIRTPVGLTNKAGETMDYPIRTIELHPNGNVFVSFSGMGVVEYDQNWNAVNEWNTTTQFYHNEIFAVHPDADGNIWFGAYGAGLAFLNRTTNEIRYLTKDDNFPSYDINSIIEDGNGDVWIATAGQGVFKYDGETFVRYGKADGLLSDFANSITIDRSGQAWVGHRKGVSLIQADYDIIRTFYHPEDLGETESLINAIDKDDDGNIWVGNPYGVTKIVLPHLHHEIRTRSTHITDIRLFYKPEDLTAYSEENKIDNILPSGILFPHDKNHITFDFVSINLKNPDAIYYKYRLEGYDREWSPISKTNLATYTNLDPGEYTFQIMESDHDDYWQPNFSEVSFGVDLPYWNKWWFLIFEMLIVGLVILMTFKFLSKVENKLIARLLIYVSLFIFFESIHTRFEPYLDDISGEIPIFQVVTNLILALLLFPVEGFVSFIFKKKADHEEFDIRKLIFPQKIENRYSRIHKVYSPDHMTVYYHIRDRKHPNRPSFIYYSKWNVIDKKWSKDRKYAHFNEQAGNQVLEFDKVGGHLIMRVLIDSEMKAFPVKEPKASKRIPKHSAESVFAMSKP